MIADQEKDVKIKKQPAEPPCLLGVSAGRGPRLVELQIFLRVEKVVK
jgi:hypothetical protein